MSAKHRFLPAVWGLLAALFSATSWPYGGGGGSSSCQTPQFFTESPANNTSVKSLSDFSFVASRADPKTLTVKINGTTVPPTITPMANGDVQVAIHLETPLTKPGKVQVTVDAKSKEGCAAFKPYYIGIKP